MRKPRLTRRPSDPGPSVLTAAAALLRTAGAVAVVIVPILALVWVAPHSAGPAPDDPPGSGVVVRSEVTVVWAPRAFRDGARAHGGPWTVRSTDELRSFLSRNGLQKAWYAVAYKGYQLNGDSAEITQVRHLNEAADHLDELRDVIATASGEPPRHDGLDYSRAAVVIIPDALLTVDPTEAMARLSNGPAGRSGGSLEGGFLKRRLSESAGALPHPDASGERLGGAPR